MGKVSIYVCQKCWHLMKGPTGGKTPGMCEKCGAKGTVRKRNEPGRKEKVI